MVRSPADIKQGDWRDFRGIMQMDTHGGTSFLVVFLRKWIYPTVLSAFLFLVILNSFLASFGGWEALCVPFENWWPHWGTKRQNSAVSHPNIVGNLASRRTQLCMRHKTVSGPEEVRWEVWKKVEHFFVGGPRDKRWKRIGKQIILLLLFMKWLVLNWILPCWFFIFLWCVGFPCF